MVSRRYDESPCGDDEESALVCPVENFNTGKQKESTKPDRVSSLLYPLRQLKLRLYAETCQCITAIVLLTLVMGGCVVSFLYCKVCLVGIIVVSACMCPWIPYFNIPLWISILMLVLVGWKFTNGKFHFIWD